MPRSSPFHSKALGKLTEFSPVTLLRQGLGILQHIPVLLAHELQDDFLVSTSLLIRSSGITDVPTAASFLHEYWGLSSGYQECIANAFIQ